MRFCLAEGLCASMCYTPHRVRVCDWQYMPHTSVERRRRVNKAIGSETIIDIDAFWCESERAYHCRSRTTRTIEGAQVACKYLRLRLIIMDSEKLKLDVHITVITLFHIWAMRDFEYIFVHFHCA